MLGMYHYLKGKGYDDDHIILIMADDIAYNEKNPLQGVVRREIGGDNLYKDLQIDYKLGDLTLEDLKRILTGEPSEKYPVTLSSSENDNVLFFWSGHGTKKGELKEGLKEEWKVRLKHVWRMQGTSNI